jgi:hypothetical protein
MKKLMKNPCWKGYVAYRMKKTRKGLVPNCIRKKVSKRKTRRRR